MIKVGYLVADPDRISREEAAAWKFLLSGRQFQNTFIPLSHLGSNPSRLGGFPVLWWHYDSSTLLPPFALSPSVIEAIRKYVMRGGSLFLSLLAAQYIVDLGAEEVRPNVIEKGRWNRRCWAEKYPDIRGLSSFQGHPVFDGLHGAAFLWNPRPQSVFAGAWYEAPSVPKNGCVVAVEREYIKLNEDWRMAVEYKLGKGRILAVGSFMFFADGENRFRPHLELFTRNCLHYLFRGHPERPRASAVRETRGSRRVTFWNFQPRSVLFTRRAPRRSVMRPTGKPWKPNSSELVLTREQATSNFFDVGGRRILIMGTEKSGIEEVWAHPFRILKDVKIGFKVGTQETVWADNLEPKITVKPESLTRTFSLDAATIEETTFADVRMPVGAIHFEVTSGEVVEIVLTATIDLRVMWPLSDAATGSLAYSWDDSLQAAVVRAVSATGTSVLGSSLQPTEYVIGRYAEIKESGGRFVGTATDGLQVAIGLRYALDVERPGCTVAFAGSSVSEREATTAYKHLFENPTGRLNAQAQYFKSLLASVSHLSTWDSKPGAYPELATAFQWAIVATDRFFVETPGVGTSLMAGYGTTRTGWNGEHTISGRPGYAWYFGRDSVWTALAMIAYGDLEKVRSVLEFLGNYQDITGKIAHEITTSGHVHYDAADSTPLYIILMGRYLKASNDLKFVRTEFQRILKAIEFCFSTDTDSDHLIENTNVGHGWIEGGPLFPAHAELYLNACWAAALDEASSVARKVGRREDEELWGSESRRVKRIISRKFWDSESGFYRFAKNSDGTFNPARTVLPTVAMYFGPIDRKKARQCLREYSSRKFSTEWGVRLVPNDDSRYNPNGYHCGSVWPLFTGWTALAELKSGLRENALKRLINTLELHKKFALGYLPEVLHGERCEPAGVCAHQAWSEALTVLGLLEAWSTMTPSGKSRHRIREKKVKLQETSSSRS